jgi:hypothetical protein
MHGNLRTLVGVADYALYVRDPVLFSRVDAIYRYVRSEATRFGFLPEVIGRKGDVVATETCALMDYIGLAVTLANHGHPEYWGDVERVVRNQLVENQAHDLTWLHSDSAKPDTEQFSWRDIGERMAGGWAGWSSPTHFLAACENLQWGGPELRGKTRVFQNCCGGSGVHALFIAWKNAARFENETLSIHLHIDKLLPQAEIRSYQPYQGFLTIDLKVPCKVRVRIPDFVEPGALVVEADGELVTAKAFGNYLELGQRAAGQKLKVSYPLPLESEEVSIGNPGFRHYRYRVTWKGNTVVKMEPLGNEESTGYSDFDKKQVRVFYGKDGPGPLYQRAALLTSDKPRLASLHLDNGALDFWASLDGPPTAPSKTSIPQPNSSGIQSRRLEGVRVGAAATEFEADDSMILAGGITAGKATGQEGKLRAVAVVLDKQPFGKLAIVACDVLMMTRADLDPVEAEIEKESGIPVSRILINCTHTHHAPSTVRLHGYDADPEFTRRVQRAIVKAVKDANVHLSADECELTFALGHENTVGQNSRMLLEDGRVYWVGPRDGFVRPTGPFDPELPVLAFRNPKGDLVATIFNHSTHTIGAIEPGKRSPAFYGLAGQQLESELGGIVCFLEGASGSTHNLDLTGSQATARIHSAVQRTLEQAKPRPVERLAAMKKPFKFRVRNFDEEQEDRAVVEYCRKYVPSGAGTTADVFRNMRKHLAVERGQERETWLQVLVVGDIAIVGVPAEFFTKFGLDIKNRSPFRYTYVAELANDWIGYLPDLEGHKLGGYQTWTGYHSYAEPGTGERIVEEVVAMLLSLHE